MLPGGQSKKGNQAVCKDSFSSPRCCGLWGPEERAQDSLSYNEWDSLRERVLKLECVPNTVRGNCC